MTEVWKNMIGFEGLYQVSNYGRVRGLDRETIGKPPVTKKKIKGVIISPKKYTNGYFFVAPCKNGLKKPTLLHRLVATHFIPNPDNLPEINHKDENKANNRASNLEWCTHKYNSNYGTKGERTSKRLKKKKAWAGQDNPNYGRRGNDSPKAKPIRAISECGKTRHFGSIIDASEQLNMSVSLVSKILHGRKKDIKGLKFEFITNN